MKKLIDRFIYFVGLLTVCFSCYVLAFYLVDRTIIYPYESPDRKVHPIRPLYNNLFYPLRWVKANGMSLRSRVPDELYGWLEKRPSTSSDEDIRYVYLSKFEGGGVSLGFTGDAALLRGIDNIDDGKYVVLLLGRALSSDGDRFINKIISYREIDLPPDPRIGLSDSVGADQEVQERMREVDEGVSFCVNRFLDEYRDKVYSHCIAAGYANRIGGGCAHIMSRVVHSNVMKKALDECN